MEKGVKKQISTEQTDANLKAVIRLLTGIPSQLEEMRKALPSAEVSEPLGEGERSFIEVLAHLLNCEARSFEAITLALLAKEPVLTHIHPERDLGKLLRYEHLPVDELLAYFSFRRRSLLNVLNALKESQWSRAIRPESKQRKESVYWQARGLALHELEHVQDLQQKISKRTGK
jgi:hypothetical protein